MSSMFKASHLMENKIQNNVREQSKKAWTVLNTGKTCQLKSCI